MKFHIISLQPRISKVFARSLKQLFLTVGMNNIGKEIPFHEIKISVLHQFVNLSFSRCLNTTNRQFDLTARPEIQILYFV